MSDLRLLNPQPMETLDADATAFVEMSLKPLPSFSDEGEPERIIRPASDPGRLQLMRAGYTFHAWSYTATFEKGEGNG